MRKRAKAPEAPEAVTLGVPPIASGWLIDGPANGLRVRVPVGTTYIYAAVPAAAASLNIADCVPRVAVYIVDGPSAFRHVETIYYRPPEEHQ